MAWKMLPNKMPESFAGTSSQNNVLDTQNGDVFSTNGSTTSPKRKRLDEPTAGTSSQSSIPGTSSGTTFQESVPGTSSNFIHKKGKDEPKAGSSAENLNVPAMKPFSVKVIGKDKAVYSLEIFMRDSATCVRKNDKARKSDPPCPIIYDKNGKPNAIIPANHKILIYCQRTAVKPNQRIRRGSYVLFKFFVDGEALSDGQLHEASVKEPDIHWAKAHIDTHHVRDDQTVEEANQANPFIGTFVVKVFTKLRETTVKEGFQAVPEDDRVHEKTKRRICCAIDMESSSGENGQDKSSRKVEEYKDGTPGLVEVGGPQAVVDVSYDDLVGTRGRHLYEKAFQIDKMREAGVSEAMLREAFPGGVPLAIADGTVINLDDDDIKEEKIDIKDKKEDLRIVKSNAIMNTPLATAPIKKESDSESD